MEENTLVFQLSKELEYTKKGDFTTTATLEIRPPGMTEYDETMDFAQGVMRALRESSEGLSEEERQTAVEAQGATEEGSGVTGEDLIPVLLSAKAVKFTNTARNFRALLPLVCTTDGETKLTKSLIDKMNPQDFTRLLGEFAANFIVPSLI